MQPTFVRNASGANVQYNAGDSYTYPAPGSAPAPATATVIPGTVTTPSPTTPTAPSAPTTPTTPAPSTPAPKVFSRIGSTDPTFTAAQDAAKPTPVEREDTTFQKLYDQSSGVVSAIEDKFNAALAGIANWSKAATGGVNSMAASSGLLNSPEAYKGEEDINVQRQQKVDEAQVARNEAINNLTSTLRGEARTIFTDSQARNDKQSADYVTAQQSKAQAAIKSLAAAGTSLDAVKTADPEGYDALVQYYGGDENRMKADWVSAASPVSLDGGKPIQAGSSLIYTFQDPITKKPYTTTIDTGVPLSSDWTAAKDGDGNIIIYNKQTGKTRGMTSGVADVGGSGSGGGSSNSVATIDASKPTGDKANVIDPATGFTPSAIYQDALGFGLKGTLPSMGLGSNSQVRKARAAIQNKAAAIADAAGVDLPTVQAEYKANSAALAKILPQYNQTVVNEQNATKNFELVYNLAQKMDKNTFQTASPMINNWIRTGQVQVGGNKDVNNFMSALVTAVTEYAKVVTGQTSGAGVTDAARSEMKTILNSGLNAPAIRSFIDNVAAKDMDNRVSSYHDQIGNISEIIGSFLDASRNSEPGTASRPAYQNDSATSTDQNTSADASASPGDIIEYNGQQYTVGADGESLTPVQ